jgi:hypothetical protein
MVPRLGLSPHSTSPLGVPLTEAMNWTPWPACTKIEAGLTETPTLLPQSCSGTPGPDTGVETGADTIGSGVGGGGGVGQVGEGVGAGLGVGLPEVDPRVMLVVWKLGFDIVMVA